MEDVEQNLPYYNKVKLQSKLTLSTIKIEGCRKRFTKKVTGRVV